MMRMSPVKNAPCTRAMSASTTRRQVNRPENPTPFCVALRNWIAKLRPNRNEKMVKNLPKVSRFSSVATSAIEGAEEHEVRARRLAGEEARDRMRDDDAEQRIGAQHVDDRDAVAWNRRVGWSLHVSGAPRRTLAKRTARRNFDFVHWRPPQSAECRQEVQ